ncbi:sigma factor-like helix-turn-helix DNA-binding protein [Streptomyces sp. NPDC060065]|uniref:sigma factor-like helix-turn-helix DNA-binding protein n=1 Tax=Streptomyces sp. NPDC060065 TaxID=3347050 RepID=UPI003681E410
MSRIEEFEEARPLLFSIAHRMLGGAGRAEDAVHQAWLHYEAAPEEPASGREFLTAAVTRVCVDVLRRARPLPDEPPGPLPSDPQQGLERPAEPPAAAVLALLERLSPLERAVFVLREVFGCGPSQIASAVGCSEEASHQLTAAVSRAGDGGGTAPPWPRCIAGADHVARIFAVIVPALVRIGVRMEPRQVNHRPGAVFRDRNGTVLSALALDILDGRIQTIRWVNDPDLSAADASAPA